MTWAPKDPDSKMDYKINWLNWLTSVDELTGIPVIDTIIASVWVDVHADLTVESDHFTDSTTTVWLTGGVIGETYKVVNRINTTAGRIQDKTVELECKAR
jgi:hypothetical protein